MQQFKNVFTVRANRQYFNAQRQRRQIPIWQWGKAGMRFTVGIPKRSRHGAECRKWIPVFGFPGKRSNRSSSTGTGRPRNCRSGGRRDDELLSRPLPLHRRNWSAGRIRNQQKLSIHQQRRTRCSCCHKKSAESC